MLEMMAKSIEEPAPSPTMLKNFGTGLRQWARDLRSCQE
jgi:hypothetical protein